MTTDKQRYTEKERQRYAERRRVLNHAIENEQKGIAAERNRMSPDPVTVTHQELIPQDEDVPYYDEVPTQLPEPSAASTAMKEVNLWREMAAENEVHFPPVDYAGDIEKTGT